MTVDDARNVIIRMFQAQCDLFTNSPWHLAHGAPEPMMYSTGADVDNPTIDSKMPPGSSCAISDKILLIRHNIGVDQEKNLLIVPPEAGHNSYIVDYGPGQSLVQCAIENYHGSVWSLHNLPATASHTSYGIADAVYALSVVSTIINRFQPIDIVGLCQGGWLSTIYAAMYPKSVSSLTVAAAPIDFHAGSSMVSLMAKSIPMAAYESMVAVGGGNMPGCFILGGFMLMNAYDRFVGDEVELINNMHSPVYVARNKRFTGWYHDTQPVPGAMYLEAVDKLFKRNLLIKGELTVADEEVYLGNIECPVFAIAGSKDDITPKEQVFALGDHVISSYDEYVVNAGHIGCFIGVNSIKEYWKRHFREINFLYGCKR
jgi:poly(3-hydroxybutyrate) depolymerase